MDKRTVVAIIGPTASAKTRLAVELAQRVCGEIIGADSRQVYRQMDSGTAKPMAEERAAVRHHLVDVVEPDEPFSLGRWLELANEALEGVWASGKQPLLVGGTGQYVWALVEGWRVPRVPPNDGLRTDLGSRAPAELMEELRRVDPEAEEFLDPRNVRRVVRALEVYHATGRPFSYWRTKEPPAFESLILGLRISRDELYRRIDDRVEAMFDAGLVDEVRGLLAKGYSRDLASMSGIGYRETCEYLAGESDLETAVERTKTGTHRLARHQNAWFKASDERIRWIDAEPLDEAASKAESLVQSYLPSPRDAMRAGAKPPGGDNRSAMPKPTKHPEPISFTAIIEQGGDEGEAAWVVFPYDLKETYGIGNLVPVVVTYDGIEYRGSIAKMGPQPLLLIRKDIREKLGKAGGDSVDVTVMLHKSERTVEVPDDLQRALDKQPQSKANFERLSYSRRREYAQWIKSAKRPETRESRVAKAVEMLAKGKPLK